MSLGSTSTDSSVSTPQEESVLLLSQVCETSEETGGCGDGDTGVSVLPKHMAKSEAFCGVCKGVEQK